jgi:AcrR family transcriptional regulator
MSARKRLPTVWEHEEPERRPPPKPLNRRQIVHAAITLADKDGLDGVSLRNVAARLDVGPMRLYGYTATKEGLLDLMVDEVYGEIVEAGPLRGDWRRALKTFAQRTRKAVQEHPWFGELLGGRPVLGPNALATVEATLASLSDETKDIDVAMQAVKTLEAWLVGTLRMEASELKAMKASGLDKRQWQRASLPHVEKLLEGGAFPHVKRMMEEGKDPSLDDTFERGLECVLEGIAAQLR